MMKFLHRKARNLNLEEVFLSFL